MAHVIRKFQVFVAVSDPGLDEERRAVQIALMRAHMIPLGAAFPPETDDRGWEVIARTIDTSDYYVSIVARRGSLRIGSANRRWVEHGHQRALEIGVPVLQFVQDDEDGQAAAWNEEGVRWSNADDLARKVVEAVRDQIAADEASGHLPTGWIRGVDVLGIADELARLSAENRALRETPPELVVPDRVKPPVKLRLIDLKAPGAQGTLHERRRRLTLKPLARTGRDSLWGFGGRDATRPPREYLEDYLDRCNRAIEVALRVFNEGTDTARNVEVRLVMSNVDDVDFDFDLPRRMSAAAAPAPRAARDVLCEANRLEDGRPQVVQSIKAIPPGTHVDLQTFVAIARPDEDGVIRSRLTVTATDASGTRTDRETLYVIELSDRTIEIDETEFG